MWSSFIHRSAWESGATRASWLRLSARYLTNWPACPLVLRTWAWAAWYQSYHESPLCTNSIPLSITWGLLWLQELLRASIFAFASHGQMAESNPTVEPNERWIEMCACDGPKEIWYIRKTTFEFSRLFTSFCIFLHLITDIRPDKTKSSYCMSYCIKT